jgi:vacuolar-type H+-ATPase subunit D/Vma8
VLARRLAVARRGAEVLDEKRRGLLRERARLAASVDEARESWAQAAADAEAWYRRALLISGRRAFELARFYVPGRAEVELEWRRSLGVTYPSSGEVSLPPTPDLVAPGGSSALARAASAYGRAVAAGAHAAALTSALRRVEGELEATVRRQRALERRWIPAHEDALSELALALDETEREDAVRARWFAEARSSLVAAEPLGDGPAVSTGALHRGPSP